MNITNLIKNNASSMLTGMAIFGSIYAAVEAVKATPKAMRILDEKQIDARKNPKEAVRAVWKCYIYPAAILAGVAVCQFGVLKVTDGDKLKLIAALSYSEMKCGEYKKAAREVFGEQADTIEHKVKERAIERNPIPDVQLKDGFMWCYEPESEQWFQATTETILWAELTANKMFHNRCELRFNDFLELLPGCKKVPWGDHFGWYMHDEDGAWDYNWSFYRGGTPWIDIQPILDTENGVLEIAYGMHPGDDWDCKDAEPPEQFMIQNSIDWKKKS